MKYPQLVSMPSAVSDWLEEQLEARGIDSEVYTRYILSLLHAHTLDVIYPEDDYPFTQIKRDGGRGAGSHKRFRRAGAWWKHADADAEQIKRSAAVECLMSAAEQSCEIESLVDELCEKLKVNSEAENSSSLNREEIKINQEPPKTKKVSPKELAEKYYAAFPPLNQKEKNSYLTSNINFVTSKWPSSDKSLNNLNLISAKWTSSGSPKKAKKKIKRQSYETLKAAPKAIQNMDRVDSQRSDYLRSAGMEVYRKSFEIANNNNNIHCYDLNAQYSNVPRAPDWLVNVPLEWISIWLSRSRTSVKDIEYVSLYPNSIWSNNQAKKKTTSRNSPARRSFDYYPENKQSGGRLSPVASDEEEEVAYRAEYQPSTDVQESAIKMEYDRPYEPDSSQWVAEFEGKSERIRELWATDIELNPSPDDINENTEDSWLAEYNDGNNHDKVIGPHTETKTRSLVNDIKKNESKPLVFEQFHQFPSNPWGVLDFLKSDAANNRRGNDDPIENLNKINHCKEKSSFGLYVRPGKQNSLKSPVGPYSRPFGPPIKRRLMPPQAPHLKIGKYEDDSPEGYFKPIKNPPSPIPEQKDESSTKRYKDGTTFNITGNFNRVDFRRSSSETLYLETELGERRLYQEYQWEPYSDDSVESESPRSASDDDKFKVKFCISQNDKAIQTDECVGLLAVSDDIESIPVTVNKMEDIEFGIALAQAATKTLESQNMEDIEFGIALAQAATKTSESQKMEDIEVGIALAQAATKTFESQKMEDIEFGIALAQAATKTFESHNYELLNKWKQDLNLKYDFKIGPEKYEGCAINEELQNMIWRNNSGLCNICKLEHKWPDFDQTFDVNWQNDSLLDIWKKTGMCWGPSKNLTSESTEEMRVEIQNDADQLLSDVKNYQLFDSPADEHKLTEEEDGEDKKRLFWNVNNTKIWSFTTQFLEDGIISLSVQPTRRSVAL